MFKEFKDFLMRGNVVDLAVGVIIGASCSKIVTSFVDDVIMPAIGKLLGHVDFSNLFFNLSDKPIPTVAAAKAAGVPRINYGIFINNIVNFTIVAFAVFMLIRLIGHFRKTPSVAPTTKDCPECAMQIPMAAEKCGHCTTQLA